MGPRRRRWRRRAAQAALAALALAALGLAASGAGEELLAAALAAWGERWGGDFGDGDPGDGIGGSQGGIGGDGDGIWGAGGGMWGSQGGIGGDGDGMWGSQGGIGGAGGGMWGSQGGIGGAGGAMWGSQVGIGGAGGGMWGSQVGIGGAGDGMWGSQGGIVGAGGETRGPGGGIGRSQAGIGVAGGETGGSQAGIGGAGDGAASPGDGIWGSQVGTGGPGVGIGGPGVGIGGPGAGLGAPGAGLGGPGFGTGGPGAGLVVPGAAPPPPACSALLSGVAAPRLLLAPAPCSPLAPFLLTLVPSAPSHLERRRAVRDTWGGPWPEGAGSPRPTRTVFVLGAPPSPRQQRDLLAEARLHGDILQGDFADTYANLTRKTLLLLRWALRCCPAAPFLLKADDDVFVHVPAVASHLAAWPRRPPAGLYLGRVHWRVAPQRDPRRRHHVPAALFAAPRYPPYCSGTAYVLSRRAAAAVLRQAPAAPLALPEDVWVGLCAHRAGLRPRHWARLGGSWRVPGTCAGREMLSAHRLRPRDMREVWGRVRGQPHGGGSGWSGWALGALGVLRCRLLALGEWLWGGGDVTGE